MNPNQTNDDYLDRLNFETNSRYESVKWLNLNVFPWLLNLSQANLLFVLQNIQNNKEHFNSAVKFNKESVRNLFQKAIKRRPSKLFLIKQLFDMMNSHLSDKISDPLPENLQRILSNKYLLAMMNDDVVTRRQMDLAEIEKGRQRIKDLIDWILDSKSYDEFPEILLAALFGSEQIFFHFFYSIGELRTKIDYGNDLITMAIIGGNYRIVTALKQMKINFEELIYDQSKIGHSAIFEYQRLDILLWALKNSEINAQFLMDEAKKHKFYELMIYIKQNPDYQKEIESQYQKPDNPTDEESLFFDILLDNI